MADIASPIVVDLGKQKRKRIKRLKNGEGPLTVEVGEAVGRVAAKLGDDADGKMLVPVVIIYRKKAKRRPWPWNFKW